MGCYGIGVGRTAAAAIEQNHDEKGIIWPFPIAPFHVHLLPLTQSAQTAQVTAQLYADLQAAGIEVLWDDRDERAGVKFNDADLMGAPFQVVVGDKGLAEGVVEIKTRKTGSNSAASGAIRRSSDSHTSTLKTPPTRQRRHSMIFTFSVTSPVRNCLFLAFHPDQLD